MEVGVESDEMKRKQCVVGGKEEWKGGVILRE